MYVCMHVCMYVFTFIFTYRVNSLTIIKYSNLSIDTWWFPSFFTMLDSFSRDAYTAVPLPHARPQRKRAERAKRPPKAPRFEKNPTDLHKRCRESKYCIDIYIYIYIIYVYVYIYIEWAIARVPPTPWCRGWVWQEQSCGEGACWLLAPVTPRDEKLIYS